MTEQEFEKLKAQHEAAIQAASEARGAVNQLTSRLKTEFGLANMAEARKKLKELAAQKQKLERELEDAVENYQKEFPDEQPV